MPESKRRRCFSVADFDTVTGKGVRGRINGGAWAWKCRADATDWCDTAPVEIEVAGFRAAGETVMFLAVDGRLAGYVGVADPIKPRSRQAITELKASGIRIVLVTGDNAATATSVAKQVGIEDAKADVLQKDKYSQVRALQCAGRIVAMASVTLRVWRRPSSGSQWARAPISR